MDYQEKEARLDIYDVKKALLYRKAIGETEWDRITVMALKELLEYKKNRINATRNKRTA